MHAGIATVTFNNKSIEEIIAIAGKAGLTALEWGAKTHVPAGDTAAAEKAKTLSKAADLAITGYGAYYYGLPGEDFAPVLESAIALGAPVIRVWAGKGFLKSEECPEDLRAQITENLQKAAKDAQKYGITVATEYHAFSLTDNIESTCRLLKEAPDLRTYWQPRTHPVQGAEKDIADIALLGEKIVNAHALCWLEDGSQPLATWKEEWSRYIPALKKHTAAKAASVEFVAGNTDEQFLADAQLLTTLLSELSIDN